MGKARSWDGLWDEINQAGLSDDPHVVWAVEALRKWQQRLTCDQLDAIAELVFAVRHGLQSSAGQGVGNLPPEGTWRTEERGTS